MSNVPLARTLLKELVAEYQFDPIAKRRFSRILRLMTRVPYKRRAASKRQVIDKPLRRRIKRLAHYNPDMTEHEIANAVGLRSSGRISEVIHNLR